MEVEAERLMEKGDFRGIVELSLPCAEEGDAEAQYGIAMLVGSDETGEIFGLDEEARNEESLRWLVRAAENGHLEAAGTIADSFENGWQGLEVSADRSSCWREVEAEQVGPSTCIDNDAMLKALRDSESKLGEMP